MLDLLGNLRQFPTADHDEILPLVDRRERWGRGLRAVGVNFMAVVAMVGGAEVGTEASG